jgi:hypothetical protein
MWHKIIGNFIVWIIEQDIHLHSSPGRKVDWGRRSQEALASAHAVDDIRPGKVSIPKPIFGMLRVYHDPALPQVNSGRNKNLVNIAHIQNNG